MDRKLYIVYGNRAKQMTMELMEAAHISEEIPQGASVALKPNLVVAAEPEYGATTHAGILEGVIEYLQEHGHRDISIMEGAWVGDRTERGFAVCGYNEIGRRYNVPLYDLKRDSTRPVKTRVGTIRICERALNAGYLINLPVLKGHCQTVMTCALKNMKGCLPDTEKRHFHTMGLHRPIAALNAALKPALTIVDNICGDLNFEEGGNPVPTNRMILGHDPVQIDALGCRLMGIDIRDVDYIGYAEEWGVGSSEIADGDLIYLNEPTAAIAPQRPSGLAARLGKNVKQKSACSACYGNLIHALYQYQEREGRAFGAPISIGQGFDGQAVPGIGVGRCCRGAERCAMGCPPSAEAILRMLMEE